MPWPQERHPLLVTHTWVLRDIPPYTQAQIPSSKESGTRVKVQRSHKTGHTENWVSGGGWVVNETQSNKGKLPKRAQRGTVTKTMTF